MTWFEELVGFEEISASVVQENIEVLDNGLLRSKANGRSWKYGTLEVPTLKELEDRVALIPKRSSRRISVRFVDEDVSTLYVDPSNAGCLFQVASQFNLLEMISPKVTPEKGIGRYERDHTQGPASAIAAGAGTFYRQYFVEMKDFDARGCQQIGQSASRQIDCLQDFAQVLHDLAGAPPGKSYWEMKNGYALPSEEQIHEINSILEALSDKDRVRLGQSLRVGVQWQTQATLKNHTGQDSRHYVSQIFCSALPVSYCYFPSKEFRLFAPLILDAAYQATMAAAVLQAAQSSRLHGDDSGEKQKVYLTLLGGGAFGNDVDDICSAIHKALLRYQYWNLDVVIVTYKPTKQVYDAVESVALKWQTSDDSS